MFGAGPAFGAAGASRPTPAPWAQPAATTLAGAGELVSDKNGACVVLTSGGVDCWGDGYVGELGNGKFYRHRDISASAVPVRVVSVGGNGTLTGVTGLASDGFGYCAIVGGGGVDCWGDGRGGELGNGKVYGSGNQGSAIPVHVKGVDGVGALTGVRDLVGTTYRGVGASSYCALLRSGGVDCWGYGYFGALGNGKLYADDPIGSAVPVAVKGVGGTGVLSGISGLASADFGVCAVLVGGGVDCWGDGQQGQLGNGKLYDDGVFGSRVPVQVKGVNGTGALDGVSRLTSDGDGFCAVLSAGGVDCWGSARAGQLGNGKFYGSGRNGSALPVQVTGEGGAGILTGIGSLASDGAGYCAVTGSGGVDCWGAAHNGELGNGFYYPQGKMSSAVPVRVEHADGSGGFLTGISAVIGHTSGYCALLEAGGVDCWGAGSYGELGNGLRNGLAFPVRVKKVDGDVALTGVVSVATVSEGESTVCGLLAGGGVDCWGFGGEGELGDGVFHTSNNRGSALPVRVRGVAGTG